MRVCKSGLIAYTGLSAGALQICRYINGAKLQIENQFDVEASVHDDHPKLKQESDGEVALPLSVRSSRLSRCRAR